MDALKLPYNDQMVHVSTACQQQLCKLAPEFFRLIETGNTGILFRKGQIIIPEGKFWDKTKIVGDDLLTSPLILALEKYEQLFASRGYSLANYSLEKKIMFITTAFANAHNSTLDPTNKRDMRNKLTVSLGRTYTSYKDQAQGEVSNTLDDTNDTQKYPRKKVLIQEVPTVPEDIDPTIFETPETFVDEFLKKLHIGLTFLHEEGNNIYIKKSNVGDTKQYLSNSVEMYTKRNKYLIKAFLKIVTELYKKDIDIETRFEESMKQALFYTFIYLQTQFRYMIYIDGGLLETDRFYKEVFVTAYRNKQIHLMTAAPHPLKRSYQRKEDIPLENKDNSGISEKLNYNWSGGNYTDVLKKNYEPLIKKFYQDLQGFGVYTKRFDVTINSFVRDLEPLVADMKILNKQGKLYEKTALPAIEMIEDLLAHIKYGRFKEAHTYLKASNATMFLSQLSNALQRRETT